MVFLNCTVLFGDFSLRINLLIGDGSVNSRFPYEVSMFPNKISAVEPVARMESYALSSFNSSSVRTSSRRLP